MRGRTISIYLPDGNPRGVKVCEFHDSIVKALFSPRSVLDVLFSRAEIGNPGVYFLIGDADETGKPRVYVGEAESLIVRLKQHNATKEFWNLVVCFVSEKKNLNKAHVKFLESYCCSQLIEINKCVLENGNSSTLPNLTDQERDFVLSFFDDLRILLSSLGFPILESTKKEAKLTLICKGKDAYATGEYTEEGLIVFKGSTITNEIAPTISKHTLQLRETFLEKGIIRKDVDKLVFNEEHIFSAPSAAASFVLGRSANGWTEWKTKDGKTLDALIRRKE